MTSLSWPRASRPMVRISSAATAVDSSLALISRAAGVQHHQGHPVGDHVVHVPCDAGPFLRTGPLGAGRLLAFQLLGPLVQALDDVPAGLVPQAEGERQPHEKGDAAERRQHVLPHDPGRPDGQSRGRRQHRQRARRRHIRELPQRAAHGERHDVGGDAQRGPGRGEDPRRAAGHRHGPAQPGQDQRRGGCRDGHDDGQREGEAVHGCQSELRLHTGHEGAVDRDERAGRRGGRPGVTVPCGRAIAAGAPPAPLRWSYGYVGSHTERSCSSRAVSSDRSLPLPPRRLGTAAT